MTDHKTTYAGSLKGGQLWANAHSTETLFIFRSHGHLKGIWSDGRAEPDEALMNIEHGKAGWQLVYPAFQEEL
ncbi:MAG: hypothetical protein HZB33_01120 [Nitrospirae bacterium]|nr:hypothetical protein [Nitrospirota bacterium]